MAPRRANWSEIHSDLLILISNRIEKRSDFFNLKAVCRNWWKSIPKNPQNPRSLRLLSAHFPFEIFPSPPPLINDSDVDRTHFIVASTTFLLRPRTSQSEFKPWLITVEEFNPGKLLVRAPLTRNIVKDYAERFHNTLDVTSFIVKEVRRDVHLRCDREATFTIDRNSFNKMIFLFTHMAWSQSLDECYALVLHDKGKLLFFNLNDVSHFGELQHGSISRFDDVVNYKGAVYIIDMKGRLYVTKYENAFKLTNVCNFCICDDSLVHSRRRLVESPEGLYMIYIYHSEDLIKCKVYEFNEDIGMWDEVLSLGDQVLFVTTDSCFFLSSEELGSVGRNCIFFPKDHFPTYTDSTYPNHSYFKGSTMELEIGVFRMVDGKSGLLSTFRGYSDIFWPPPKWIFPEWSGPVGEEIIEEECIGDICSCALGIEQFDFSTINKETNNNGATDHNAFQVDNVPWSEMPSILIAEISEHLEIRDDIGRFRAICKNWRASCLPPQIPNILCSQMPYAIVARNVAPFMEDPSVILRSHMFSLIATTVYLLQPSIQSDSTPKGWLIAVEEFRPGKLFLRFPLSDQLVRTPENLPRAISLSDLHVTEIHKEYNFRLNDNLWYRNMPPAWSGYGTCQKVVLFSPNDDFTALVLYNRGSIVSFRLRDEHICRIVHRSASKFDDIVKYKGLGYAIDRKARVYVIYCESPNVVKLRIEAIGNDVSPDRIKRLAECEGQLLLIVRQSPEDDIFFKVYMLDEKQERWIYVKSIGSNILCITPTTTFVLSARQCPGWRSNCIVFPAGFFPTYSGNTYSDWGLFRSTPKGFELGVFYVGQQTHASRSIMCYPGYSDLFWPPPAWLRPSGVQPLVPDSSVTPQGPVDFLNFVEPHHLHLVLPLYQRFGLRQTWVAGVQVRTGYSFILNRIIGKFGDITFWGLYQITRPFESLAHTVFTLLTTPGRLVVNKHAVQDMQEVLEISQTLHYRVDWLVPYVDKARKYLAYNKMMDELRETEMMMVEVMEMHARGVGREEVLALKLARLDKLKNSLIEKINAVGPLEDLDRSLGADLF